MRIRSLHVTGTLVAAATLGLATMVISPGAGAHGNQARTTLYTISGERVGTVMFKTTGGHTLVRVRLNGAPGTDAFHGFHIHANNDPSNGDGCDANTSFASADGHWKADGETHGHHIGDMPSAYVTSDGSVETRFTLDRIQPADLRGKVVILHAGADNFGNIPVGAEANQYTANSSAATDLTSTTGNAGARVACGVIA
jgi:Cu-Zn family superoxide dismutase